VLGIALYASAPMAAHSGSQVLFVGIFCLILSMYGGGFATLPAYLADIFGTHYVGAIHGRLLTAWATAGIVGPVVVNYIREAQISAGVPRAQVYDFTMYILASFLVLGLIANLLVRPVAEKWYMSKEQETPISQPSGAMAQPHGSFGIGRGGFSVPALLAWTAVGIPIACGTYMTLLQTAALFR